MSLEERVISRVFVVFVKDVRAAADIFDGMLTKP
jgi:hypothetical protein